MRIAKPALLSLFRNGQPATFFAGHHVFLSGGVGDEKTLICHCGLVPQSPFILYSVQRHKMILIPMQDARQGNIFHQLFQRYPHALRVHADAFGGIADAEHRNAFAGDEAPFTQVLQGVAASVMFGNHAEAGGTAVHGVELGVVNKRFVHYKYKYY